MIQTTKQLSNIKRGLGIITQLDWVKKIQQNKDSQSTIETSFPITQTNTICELFTQKGIDIIHKTLAKSFHINIKQLNGFEKISINNYGNCDVTIEIHNANQGELFVEINDKSPHQLISTGITFITHKNTQLQIATKTNHQKEKLHLAKHLCIAHENSKVIWFSQSNGTHQVLFDQKSTLIENNSSIKTITTVQGEQKNKFDISITSHHLAQNTISDIIFKSVLEDSQVIARGMVRIEPNASNSQGNQKSNILLLDKNAKAVTIPDLEIENKDVTCSHGSTISNIDEEKLFYLESRGVSKKRAKQLIIKGFIDDLYSELSEKLTNELRGPKNVQSNKITNTFSNEVKK